MTDDDGRGESGPEGADTLDRIALDLQQLRVRAGAVSYAEIVRRVAAGRAERGVAPEACRPARTTVYDAFRTGRSRVNAELVGEIAVALGEDPEHAENWRERCHRARAAVESRGVVPAEPAPAPEPEPEPVVAPEAVARIALPSPTRPRRLGAPRTVLILFAAVAINLIGQGLVRALDLPLFLDMVGTAIAAMALGPWWGASAGLATHLVGGVLFGPLYLPFGVVNAAGGLAWGYGVRVRAFNRTPSRYFLLSLVVAFACSLVAVPLIILLGGTGHASEILMRTLETDGLPPVLAVLEGNLFTSVVDKLVAGFAALAVVGALGRGFDTPLSRSSLGHVDSALGTPRGGTSPNSPRAGMQQG